MKKVFVTGATGFLGSYLTRLLVQEGYEVHASKRPNSRMDLVKQVANKVNWHEGNILDTSFLQSSLKEIDIVFHCAAMVSFSPKDDDLMFTINVKGTKNVAKACLNQTNPPILIYASSVAALGRKKGEFTVTEDTQWQESKQNTPYARSKYLGEQAVWKGKEQGLPVGIVNPSTILGAGFWNSGSCKLFTTVSNGLKFYPVGQTGFVDVRDVARSMLLLANTPQALGERYIINGENWAYQRTFNTMADCLNVQKPSIKVGWLLRHLSWRLEKIRSLLTGKSPFITKHTAHISSLSYAYKNQKSIQTLGIQYTPLDQTIAMSSQLLQAYQTNHTFDTLDI